MGREAPVLRADGRPVDGGTTYFDSREFVARAQRLDEAEPRQARAALGLFALMVTGFGSWKRYHRIEGDVGSLARAVGVSRKAAQRSVELLIEGAFLMETTTGWKIDEKLLPARPGRSMPRGTRAIPFVHAEVWRTRGDLAGRDDVGAYHHLRDLGAHVLARAAAEAEVELVGHHDRRTLHRLAGRLAAAGLVVLRMVVRRRAAPAAAAAEGGPPPGLIANLKALAAPRGSPIPT